MLLIDLIKFVIFQSWFYKIN